MKDAVGAPAGAGGAGAGAHGTGIGTAGYTGTATTKGLRGPMRNARVFAPKAYILTQKDGELHCCVCEQAWVTRVADFFSGYVCCSAHCHS